MRNSRNERSADAAKAPRSSIFHGPIAAGLLAMTLMTNPLASAEAQTTPEDTINALNGVFGRHAGERTSHAKGFCAAGQFIPSAESSAFAISPLFKGLAMPVTARFSTGGGNPKASDKGRSVRGLGARFHLPNEEELDLVMITAPTFFAATPEQFVEFLKARSADPATGKKDPAKIKAFNDANPNVMPHLNHVSQSPPPASYATAAYHSTHAFLFEDPSGKELAARWSVEPVGGFKGLSEAQEASFPDDFLRDELRERLERGPAQWEIFLQAAEAGDPLNDPTAPWPNTRRRVNVGRLVIERLIERGAEDDCTDFVYDPNNLPSGIAATDDPILAIRSPAYAVSFGRRSE